MEREQFLEGKRTPIFDHTLGYFQSKIKHTPILRKQMNMLFLKI